MPQNFGMTMATSCLLCLHFRTCLMYNRRQDISKSVLQVPLLVPPEQAIKRRAGCIYGESRREQQHVLCSAKTACIFEVSPQDIFVCQCLGSQSLMAHLICYFRTNLLVFPVFLLYSVLKIRSLAALIVKISNQVLLFSMRHHPAVCSKLLSRCS